MTRSTPENPGRQRGLRPALPAACREFLAALDAAGPQAAPGEPAAHERECGACAAHAAFRRRMVGPLSARPALPDELSSPRLLEAIHERIVDQVAASPLGKLVASAAARPAPASDWPEPVLDSHLARATVVPPAAPSAAAWDEVRVSILSDLRAARRAWVRRSWLAAGAAAVAIASGILLTQGTATPTSIVFVDLDQVPGVEFAVVRHGPLR